MKKNASPPPAVPVATFKAKCAERLDAVHETGQPLVVTKYGRPFVQVVPCDGFTADPIGFMQGTVVATGDLVSSDHASWRASGSDPLTSAR